MIQLALVLGIGLLIFRIIWLFFNSIQSLFRRKPKEPEDPSENLSSQKPSKVSNSQVGASTNKKASSPSKIEASSKKTENKPDTSSKKQVKKAQPSQPREVMRREEEEINTITPKKYSEPIPEKPEEENKFHKHLDVNESPSKGRKLSDSQIVSYQTKIAHLTQELDKNRKEKELYIHRVEQIIEHIINNNEQNEQSRMSTEDQELIVINHLKHELNTAQQRVDEENKNLTQTFEKEKEVLVRQYQEKINFIQKDNQEKLKNYTSTIEQIERQIIIQSQEYDKLLEEKSKGGEPGGSNLSSNQQTNVLNQKIAQLKKREKEQQGKINDLEQQSKTSSQEIQKLKIEIGKKSNDEIESQAKFQAQIDSLKSQNASLNEELSAEKQKSFKLEQKLEETNFKFQNQKVETTSKQNSSIQNTQMLDLLEQKYLNEKTRRQEEERKLSEVNEQLKFCQEQLKNARDSENDLRQKIKKSNISPQKSDRSFVRKEDVERHPQYLNLKRRLEQLEGKRLSPDAVEKRTGVVSNYQSSRGKNRQVSPTFQTPVEQQRQVVSPISEARSPYRTTFGNKTGTVAPSATSTILAQRRYRTPIEKPVAHSTINEGAVGQTYLGQTNILNESQRNFIMHEICGLKKIVAKKTRLIFSSAQKITKPITDYIVSTPNMIIIAELSNKRVVGAFSQNAFSRENKLTSSSVVSKAIIFSLNTQTFINNEGKGEIIHFEENANALIWGNRQFVVHCDEKPSVSINLNCENAIYPTDHTSKQFLGSDVQRITIEKLEAHRIFFG